MTPSRPGPRPLSLALGALRDELAPATLLADVQRTWPAAVGDALAAQARPTGERQGVVTVSCSASVWAQELELMAPMVLAQLNARLPAGKVARLRCVTAGP